MDVAQPAYVPVNEVLALARTIQASRDLDLAGDRLDQLLRCGELAISGRQFEAVVVAIAVAVTIAAACRAGDEALRRLKLAPSTAS